MAIRRWLVAVAFLAYAAAHAADRTPRVEKIQARLFLADTGTWSEPVPKNATLWNTPIGEGWAKQPSTATFVTIALSGPAGHFEPNWRLEMQATRAQDGKTLVRQSQPLGTFSAQGRQHVGFWLPDTGCTPLTIQARLLPNGTPATLSLPFGCGE